jgi:sugar phosphate permease
MLNNGRWNQVGEQQEVNIWHNLGTLAVLFCGGAFMYLLPFCKNTYYVPLMEPLHVNNTQLGMMGSAFGITAMLSYLPGGWLADRISARQLMTLALIITGVGGFCLSFYPPYAICLLIHASWGITTAIFFGAMDKFRRLDQFQQFIRHPGRISLPSAGVGK